MTNKEILKRLKEIEERAVKATPGPWKAYTEVASHMLKGPPPVDPTDGCGLFARREDAEFIAHARADIPWLCDLVRKLLTVAEVARKLKYRLGVGHTVVIDLEALAPLAKALAALEEEEKGGI